MSSQRDDREYLPELLRHRLTWDAYAGHMLLGEVEILWGEAPFPPGEAAAAIATLSDAAERPQTHESTPEP